MNSLTNSAICSVVSISSALSGQLMAVKTFDHYFF